MLGTKVNRSIVLILILTLSLTHTSTHAHMHTCTHIQPLSSETWNALEAFCIAPKLQMGSWHMNTQKWKHAPFINIHTCKTVKQPNTRGPQASLHLDVRTKQVSTRTRSLSHFVKSNITLSNNSIKYVVGSSQRSSSCTQTQGQSKSFEYRFLLSFLCQ